jgi:hypothetical protein
MYAPGGLLLSTSLGLGGGEGGSLTALERSMAGLIRTCAHLNATCAGITAVNYHREYRCGMRSRLVVTRKLVCRCCLVRCNRIFAHVHTLFS